MTDDCMGRNLIDRWPVMDLGTLKNHPRYELNVYMKSIYINNFYQVLVEVSAFEMSWATFCYPSWYNSIYRDLGNIGWWLLPIPASVGFRFNTSSCVLVCSDYTRTITVLFITLNWKIWNPHNAHLPEINPVFIVCYTSCISVIYL